MSKSRNLLLFLCVFLTVSVSGLEAYISTSALQHIHQRHWYLNISGTANSRFNQSMTNQKLDAIITKTINRGSIKDSKHGQGRKVHQYRFNRPVGWGTNGKRAYSLRVVTDGNKKVITAFPVN